MIIDSVFKRTCNCKTFPTGRFDKFKVIIAHQFLASWPSKAVKAEDNQQNFLKIITDQQYYHNLHVNGRFPDVIQFSLVHMFQKITSGNMWDMIL